MHYKTASTEPLEIIRINECDHPNANDLATRRFQALWNEIERLRFVLQALADNPKIEQAARSWAAAGLEQR